MRPYILTCGLLLFGFGPANDDDPCLRCHGNVPPAAATSGPPAPGLPMAYQMDWDMFEFADDGRPPVAAIPTPHSVIHGTTFYDWRRRSMTEVYKETCIDIFSTGRDFPCQFTSVGDRTYFVRFAPGTSQPESCCLWQQSAFWAPRPDVLRTMSFDREMSYGARRARWWTLDIPPPGPFGYGVDDDGRPVAFWFPVISGWVQQVFHDFRPTPPDAEAFALPPACQAEALPICSQ